MRNAFTKFLVALLTFASNLSVGQTIDTIKNKFEKYRVENFAEKLFVHLDRTTYLTGESIWFKLYYVNGVSNKPEDLSKTAYVEILDHTNQRILEGKIALRNGHGDGSFFVPATLSTGNYMLRAYTAWMKNSEQEFFFHQPLTIINGFKAPQFQPLSEQKTKIDAQFMPEGGHLVANVNSRIGFRIADEKNRGISFQGTILNQASDSILHFIPDTLGIGSFEFMPLPDAQYRAFIKTPHGDYFFDLPEVLNEGYTLRVNNGDGKLDVIVASSFKNMPSPFVHLFVHTRNQIIVAETKFLKNNKAVFSVASEKLLDGVSHITLFDGDLKPVCERLYYKKPGNIVAIRASTNAEAYDPRSKVKLSIHVADASSSHSEDLNLSLSVYMKDSLHGFVQNNIGEYLMLSSDFFEHIESPAFYVRQANEKQLDNLMLTHGWRKFEWNEILAKPKGSLEYLPELHGPVIKGRLIHEDGSAAPNVRTFLSAPSKIIQLHTAVSRQNGDLHYIAPHIIGKQRIIFQYNNVKDDYYRFEMESPFIKAKEVNLPELKLTPTPQSILRRHVALQVQDIFYPERNSAATQVGSVSFFGKADETYYLDDYTRFPVMEEVMREYVKGVWVRKRNGEFYFKVLDNINKSVFENEPLVMLDGVPIFKSDKIMNFDPKKVQRIDVMTRTFFIGRNAFSGVVSFSTYNGDLAGFEIDKNSVVLDYEGLQAQRTFYAPKYSNESSGSRLPDQRTLLHWDPNVTTTNGSIEIEFYTSDLSGEFEVQVQGINDSGKMGSASTSFQVTPYDNE